MINFLQTTNGGPNSGQTTVQPGCIQCLIQANSFIRTEEPNIVNKRVEGQEFLVLLKFK